MLPVKQSFTLHTLKETTGLSSTPQNLQPLQNTLLAAMIHEQFLN